MRTLTLALALLASAPATAEDARIARWITDLRDDDIRWNAHDAMRELGRRPRAAIPSLETALDSSDWQQRQLAAALLADFAVGGRLDAGYQPSDRCAAVLVEALERDGLPRSEPDESGYAAFTRVYNASRAVETLVRRPTLVRGVREELEALARGTDPQARFLAAYLLGMAGVQRSADAAAPALIEHLRDNRISDDACWASAALFRLGAAALPALEKAAQSGDAQQRRLAERIRACIEHPPETAAQMRARGLVFDSLRRDPILSYRHSGPTLGWSKLSRAGG